jgi:hypothetical protein
MEIYNLYISYGNAEQLTLTYEATADGIKFDQGGECGNFEITTMDYNKICIHVNRLLNIMNPDRVKIVVGNGPIVLQDDEIIQKIWKTNDIKARFQNYYDSIKDDIEEDDLDVSLYSHHYDEIIEPLIRGMVGTVKFLKREKEVKGENCPVTHEPMDGTAHRLKKCGHYISKEGWSGIRWVDRKKNCPLCRQEYDMSEHNEE